MSWKPIVVGVDASPAAASAAQLGLRIAAAAHCEFRLVHATRAAESLVGDAGLGTQAAAIRAAALHEVRGRIESVLAGEVPWDVLHDLHVREGWPPAALDDEVHQCDAELLVLGAKHHTTLGRWLGGSTVHNVARMLRVPLLVAGSPPTAIRRVLVALDASTAARPTFEFARRCADLFDAELRVLHVIEPMPILPEAPPPVPPSDFQRLMEEECEKKIWPLVGPDADTVVRHTTAEGGIAAEALTWKADLVVVGSHGKGFVERMLVGSVTERLLNHLPSPMLLVIPARQGARRGSPVVKEGEAALAR